MKQSEVTPKNIVLIGFMGSGKSTVGRQLHQRLGYPLSDMDQLIEQTAGKKITEIFKEEGESAFRDFETLQLLEIAKQTDTRHIISTGGGIIIREENRQLLRKMGYVIWLVASPEEIHNRTSRNNNRPLLNNEDPAGTIRKLLETRTPLYKECAHLAIETNQLNLDEITTGIIESARYYFSQPE